MSPSEELPPGGEPAMPQSAPPEAADSPELPELSAEDLRDLVPVANAMNMAEAAFLATVLEDAGIPAIEQGPSLNLPITHCESGVNRVCVPRKYKDQAIEALKTARSKARDNAIDEAFSEEGIEETLIRDKKSREIWDIGNLQDLQPEERKAKLEPLIAKWLVEEVKPEVIAQRLAVSGLSREEAGKLVNEVVENRPVRINDAKFHRIGIGSVLILAGVAMLLVSIIGYGTACIVIGFMFVALGLSVKPQVPDWAKPKDPA